MQAEAKLKWIEEDKQLRAQLEKEGKDEEEQDKAVSDVDVKYERDTGRQRCKVWPAKLFLQGDNASQNKCNAFFQYCAWLVRAGIFETVRVSFMLVGHTHDIVDQVFSRITTALRSKDCLSVQEYMERVPKAYRVGLAKNVSAEEYQAGAQEKGSVSDSVEVIACQRADATIFHLVLTRPFFLFVFVLAFRICLLHTNPHLATPKP